MKSLRTRLLALWLVLAVSGTVTSLLLVEFYRESANALVARTEEAVARSCRDLGERYAFYMAGTSRVGLNAGDSMLKRDLAGVVSVALGRAPGVEGGIWQHDEGSLAYAFPTYEGTGPKTDLPPAELSTIREVNAQALQADRPVTIRQTGQSQVLVVEACPLPGPIEDVTGWTMARAFTGEGRAYNQLLMGLAMLAFTVIGSAVWLARILYSWSHKIARLETALAQNDPGGTMDVPALPRTGERELDRLVDALNAAGTRLAAERRRALSAERLAALGRLAAVLAHEIRNPIAAMRLKAENALAAGNENRRLSALRAILDQVGRLDGLLRDLLAITQHARPKPVDVELASFLTQVIEPHLELATAKGVTLEIGHVPRSAPLPRFDAAEIRRALDNLILNGIQNTPAGGAVTVQAAHHNDRLYLRVRDTGPGVPEDIRERLFEPFVTGRAEGSGLGLAIVREAALAHGGEVRLVPVSVGAVFEIELPWRQS
jgi:signal transduction histidine kinase